MAPRTYRRKATRRRPTYKRRPRKSTMYRVARRVAYQIAETKYYDSVVATPDLANNGLWSPQVGNDANHPHNKWAVLDLLNSIIVGNTNHTRIGNKIMVKYIQIYIAIGMGKSQDLESGTCRFLLIRDKGTQGNLIDVAGSYFDPVGPYITGQQISINAPKNSNNLRRYATLLDRQHSVQLFGGSQDAKTATPVMNFYIPVNRVFTYKAGTDGWNGASCMVEETIQFALAADMSGCCNVSLRFRVAYKDA